MKKRFFAVLLCAALLCGCDLNTDNAPSSPLTSSVDNRSESAKSGNISETYDSETSEIIPEESLLNSTDISAGKDEAADEINDNETDTGDDPADSINDTDISNDNTADSTKNIADSADITAESSHDPTEESLTNGSDNVLNPSAAGTASKPSGGGNSNFNTWNIPEHQNTTQYVLNTNTKKFHLPSCNSVVKISPKNYDTISSRESAIANGYSPCKKCNHYFEYANKKARTAVRAQAILIYVYQPLIQFRAKIPAHFVEHCT